MEEGADLGGRGVGDEVGEEGDEVEDGLTALGGVGCGGDEGLEAGAFGVEGVEVGEQVIVGLAVHLGVELAGGEGEGEALAAGVEVAEAAGDAVEVGGVNSVNGWGKGLVEDGGVG